MKDLISIIDVKDHVGETVKIGAWVADKSGKGKLQFLQLRDGTAFFQAVVFKPNMIEKFGEEEGTIRNMTIRYIRDAKKGKIDGKAHGYWEVTGIE